VELLVLLTVQYKGLQVCDDAALDLKDLRADKEARDLVAKEQKEAKARLLLLDGLVQKADGDLDRARQTFEKVVKSHQGTRAAKDAAKAIAGERCAGAAPTRGQRRAPRSLASVALAAGHSFSPQQVAPWRRRIQRAAR
jgi:hypothetical protein